MKIYSTSNCQQQKLQSPNALAFKALVVRDDSIIGPLAKKMYQEYLLSEDDIFIRRGLDDALNKVTVFMTKPANECGFNGEHFQGQALSVDNNTAIRYTNDNVKN